MWKVKVHFTNSSSALRSARHYEVRGGGGQDATLKDSTLQLFLIFDVGERFCGLPDMTLATDGQKPETHPLVTRCQLRHGNTGLPFSATTELQ